MYSTDGARASKKWKEVPGRRMLYARQQHTRYTTKRGLDECDKSKRKGKKQLVVIAAFGLYVCCFLLLGGRSLSFFAADRAC
jgi:hypothetical protein